MTPCPYCTVPFEPVRHGAYIKAFCSAACRHAHQNAARRLGEVTAATMKPGALRDWYLALPSRATPQCASRGRGGPEQGEGRKVA